MENTTLDPDIVRLAQATRNIESGGNPTAVGKNGEYGYYQYLPQTWNTQAKAAGINVPLKDATPEQQNEVWYKWAAAKKAQGNNIGQIASMQNAGEGKPNAYLEGNSGTNSSGVQYDTAVYAKRVATEYQKLKAASGGSVTTPPAPDAIEPINLGQQNNTQITSNSPTLGQNLSNRLQDATTGLNSLIGGEANTGQSRFSGALQIAGAAAGGLGDVVNKGLELIPGVKQVEGLLGQGAGKLLQTPIGQKVAGAIQSFSNAHPELSKDIGAGFNIVTAIPILKGLGSAVDVAKDAVASSLQGIAEKSVQSGLESTIGKAGLRGGIFLSDNPTLAADMVEQRAIPTVTAGKYDSLGALKDSQSRIANLGNQVKTTLNGPQFSTPIEDTTPIINKAISSFPHSDFTNEDMITNAKNLTPQNSKLWDKFEKGEANLKEINTLRSDLDKSVKSVYTSTNEPPIKKEMGASLAGAMREYVQSTAKETQALFAGMAKEYRIQKALGYLHNKTVNTGVAGMAEKAAGTVEGEIIGSAHGMPLVGGFIGRQAGGLVAKRLAGVPEAILARTGKGAVRSSLANAAKTIGKGALGALAQKAV